MNQHTIKIQQKNLEEYEILDIRKEKEIHIKDDTEEMVYRQTEYFGNRPNNDVLDQKNEESEIFNGQTYARNDEPAYFANKWQKIGKFFLYLLIFLIPLFFLPLTVAPLETNKTLLAVILVFLSFICYLTGSLSSKKIIYPDSRIVLAVFAVVGITVLSYFLSEFRYASFYGDLMQPDSLLVFVICGLAFFLASVFFKKEDFNKIGTVFLASLILASIIGILQFTEAYILPFDFTKQASFNTVGQSFSYGVFLAFGFLMIIAALSELKLSLAGKSVLILGGILAIVQLAVFNFRMLWLEIALGILLLVAYKFTQSLGTRDTEASVGPGKMRTSGMEIPLAGLIISLLFFLISPSLPQSAKIPVQIKPNLSTTLAVAKENLKGKNIILGSGPSIFSPKFALYRPLELNETNFWSVKFSQGFSFFATSLVTLGIIGVLAFFALIVSFIFLALKNLENKRALIISIGVLLLFAELFLNDPFLVQFIFIFLGLGLILAMSSPLKEISLSSASKAKAFTVFIFIIGLITASLALLYSVGQKYVAAVYYGKAVFSGDFKESFNDLQSAAVLDPESDRYLRDLSQYLLMDTNNQKLDEKDKTDTKDAVDNRIQSEIASAVRVAQTATIVNPSESLNWSNLADIYGKIVLVVGGADIFAEKNYEEAIARDPKNPALQVNLAMVLLNSADRLKAAKPDKDTSRDSERQNKLAKAETAVNKAIELKADYLPAHFQLAMIYVRQEKMKEALARLEELKKAAPLDADLSFQLGALYYNNNETEKAQAELERTVSLNEKYSNARYVLGLIYDKTGKKFKAIDQFEEILALNPGNQEVKKILKNLNDGKNALNGLGSPAEPAETVSPQANLEKPSETVPAPN